MNTASPIKLPAGVYDDLDDVTYHGDAFERPSISSTGIRQVLKDPAEYWATSPINPVYAARKQQEQAEAIASGKAPRKRHFEKGKAAHVMLLEPERINDCVSVIPSELLGANGSLSTKAAKAFAAEQDALGRSVLKPDEWDAICDMAEALDACAEARELMAECFIEQSHIWEDPLTGVYLKSRPDLTPNQTGGWIVDYKSTDVTDIDQWVRKSLCDFRLDIQAALQCWGASECRNMDVLGVCYLVQSTVTKRVALRYIPRDSDNGRAILAAARNDLRNGIDRFAQCLRKGIWPSNWDGGMQEMIAPEWRRKQIDRQLEEQGADWFGYAA